MEARWKRTIPWKCGEIAAMMVFSLAIIGLAWKIPNWGAASGLFAAAGVGLVVTAVMSGRLLHAVHRDREKLTPSDRIVGIAYGFVIMFGTIGTLVIVTQVVLTLLDLREFLSFLRD